MYVLHARIRLGGLLSGSGSPVEIDWYLLALPELSSTGDFGPGFNPFNHAALAHLDLGSVSVSCRRNTSYLSLQIFRFICCCRYCTYDEMWIEPGEIAATRKSFC